MCFSRSSTGMFKQRNPPDPMAAKDTITPGWFSIRGAALYTGFSVTAIRTAMSKGRFPFHQVEISGGPTKETRIRRDDLDAWIQGQRAT